MKTFVTTTSVPVLLKIDNVDTDMIIPKDFLKTIKRDGLGKSLFYEMRYDLEGRVVPSFPLNQDAYKNSKILVSGDNFGCGSSREHAVWSISDFGINVVIAKSFADIFKNNCYENGILPIALGSESHAKIVEECEQNNELTVNLESQEIVGKNCVVKFEIEDFRKHCLINGLDQIGVTMQSSKNIDNFEDKQRSLNPWLYE